MTTTLRLAFPALLGVAFGTLLLASPSFAGDSDRTPATLPLEGEGHLACFVDVATFRGAQATDLEIYVSVSNEQLEFEEQEDGSFRGRLKLRFVVRNEEGREVAKEEFEVDSHATSALDATDHAINQVIRQAFEVEPGLYHLEVRVSDEKSLRPGLFNRMRQVRNDAELGGWFDVRPMHGSGTSLSDVMLVRSMRPDTGSGFGRSGIEIDPNPSRFYGLVLPQVRAFVEVYDSSFEAGDKFLVETILRDRADSVVVKRVARAEPTSGAFVVHDSVDLDARVYPPGTYFMEFGVINERTAASAREKSRLEIVWALASWQNEPERILEEMSLIMRQEEYNRLKGLSPGAREVYLAEYWHGLDPDPDTPLNEAWVEFQRRVRYADREFDATLQRGILTDRGRVWVRYGPPDDRDYQFSSSSYGSDDATQRVADPSERVGLGSRPSSSFLDADAFREGDVSDVATQRGGTNVKSKEIVTWTYDGTGHVLTGRDDLDQRSHRGLKFIFADQIGNGNFVLIGSSGATVY